MVRQYGNERGGSGIWVPRWVVLVAVFLFLLWFGLRIFVPPMWTIQRLDAPDGARSARLLRSVHTRHHFVVQLKDGMRWQTAYYSEPIPDDYRVDLEERLRWSDDGQVVWFRLRGEPVWAYDFERGRALRPAERETRGQP